MEISPSACLVVALIIAFLHHWTSENLAIQFSKLFFRQPSTAKAKWEVKLASLADKFHGGTQCEGEA